MEEVWIRLGTVEARRINFREKIIRALRRAESDLDDLAVLVCASAMVEYYLREFIGTKANMALLEPEGNADAILSFAMMVRLARALDVLPERLVKPLKKFARLRNEFAHDIGRELRQADIDELHKSLEPADRENCLAETRSAATNRGEPESIRLRVRIMVAWIGDELEKLAIHDGSDPL